MRVAVIGAGITALAITHALARRGVDTTRIAPRRRPCASDVPVAIAQPVMGQRASVSALRIEGYRAARALAERAPNAVVARGLLRVALQPRRAAWYARKAPKLPPEIATWWDADTCARPGLAEVGGGIWIPDAVALHLPALLDTLDAGAQVRDATVQQIAITSTEVALDLSDGDRVLADRVVVAAGLGSAPLLRTWWDAAILRSELAGEILMLEVPDVPPFMVGETGQLVPLFRRADGSGRVAVTASQREDGVPGQLAGVGVLLDRAVRVWPSTANGRVAGLWTGRRSTTHDAHPALGPVSPCARVWVATGMGSRGLLFGALTGEQVAEAFVAGASPEARWSPHREVPGSGAKTTNPHSGG